MKITDLDYTIDGSEVWYIIDKDNYPYTLQNECGLQQLLRLITQFVNKYKENFEKRLRTGKYKVIVDKYQNNAGQHIFMLKFDEDNHFMFRFREENNNLEITVMQSFFNSKDYDRRIYMKFEEFNKIIRSILLQLLLGIERLY